MTRTAVIMDSRYRNHFPGPNHPERPERVEVLMETVEKLNRPGLTVMAPREATRQELELCHDPQYIDRVAATRDYDRYAFDADTRTSRESYATALLAVGGVLTATEAVLEGKADNAFAIVRPPGHHALRAHAMGFCLFNNVAIAAASLLRHHGLSRVMIIDWDLHHGNGTQDIFYTSDQVLYVSLHQFPHYPGSGNANEIGNLAGEGFTVNVPLPAGSGDDDYLKVFDEIVLKVGERFKPEFVLISCGFDAHALDPLGAMQVSDRGFGAMAQRVKALADRCCSGRMVAALEGGYDLTALRGSAEAVLNAFGAEQNSEITPPAGIGGRSLSIIDHVKGILQPYWSL